MTKPQSLKLERTPNPLPVNTFVAVDAALAYAIHDLLAEHLPMLSEHLRRRLKAALDGAKL